MFLGHIIIMVTPRKGPLGVRPPAALQNFAPIVKPQPRKEASRTTYREAVDLSVAIKREAINLGFASNIDLMTSLIVLGHNPEKIVTLLTEIFEAHGQPPVKAKAMAEQRLSIEYERALRNARFLIKKREKALEKQK